jgi:hypothetical protein
MNVAIIENGIVTNIIVGPLPEDTQGVSVEDRPVAIGDAYTDGVFLRNGEPVLTSAERIAALEQEILALQEQLNG